MRCVAIAFAIILCVFFGDAVCNAVKYQATTVFVDIYELCFIGERKGKRIIVSEGEKAILEKYGIEIRKAKFLKDGRLKMTIIYDGCLELPTLDLISCDNEGI
jgi:hypothetical protein